MRDFPITLPSLQIAVLRLPVPMSAADYVWLMELLEAMRAGLVGPPAPCDRQHVGDEVGH